MYNYKLCSWRLGVHPFAMLGDKEVLKLETGKSINESLLLDLMKFTSNKINYVKINDTFIIDTFITKDVIDNKVVIEYSITKDSGISEINKVDFYDIDGNIKSSLNVYVPIVEGVELKHIINIKEGVI